MADKLWTPDSERWAVKLFIQDGDEQNEIYRVCTADPIANSGRTWLELRPENEKARTYFNIANIYVVSVEKLEDDDDN